jgi:regulatory protein
MEGAARKAYSWALRQLARRMRTEYEIREGLTRKGFDDEAVDSVIKRLHQDRYLDDGEFASQWVRSRSASRYYGSRKLADELRKKGVAPHLARQALDEHLPLQREEELAGIAARRRAARIRSEGPKRKATLYRYLVGKGFSPGAIWTALGSMDDQEEVI